MSKIGRLILIICVSIVVIFVMAAIAMFSLFTDNTDVTARVAQGDGKTFSEYKGEMLYNAFNDTAESAEIAFSFTEEELNLFLNAFLRENVSGSNGATFVYGDNGIVNMKLSIKYGIIRTVISANVCGEMTANSLEIKLKNFRLGKASEKLTKLFVNEKTLKKLFEKAAISGVNIDGMDITFSKSSLKDTVKKLYESSENVDLYDIVLGRSLADDDMLGFEWCRSGKIGLTLSLKDMSYDIEKAGEAPYTADFSEVTDKTEKLLNDKIITPENSSLFFRYIVQGYENLKDEEKTVVSETDLSVIGIENPTNYGGIFYAQKKTMGEIIASQLKNISFFGGLQIGIDEYGLNAAALRFNTIGKGNVFYKKNDAGQYSINFVAVESLYFNVEDDEIKISVLINVNGKRLAAVCGFFAYSSSDFAMIAQLNDTRLGNIICTDEEKTSLVKYLERTFENENWISCDVKEKCVILDFEELIDNKILTGLFAFGFNMNIKAKSGSDGTGLISITLSASMF